MFRIERKNHHSILDVSDILLRFKIILRIDSNNSNEKYVFEIICEKYKLYKYGHSRKNGTFERRRDTSKGLTPANLKKMHAFKNAET